MTDSPHRPGSGWGEPTPPVHPGYADPAYANQAPYGVPYQPPAPTRQLPAYSGYDPYATGTYGTYPPQPGGPAYPPPPEGPNRRWLWVLAGASVLVVLGLVVALVIVNSSDQQTVVAPAPSSGPSFTTRSVPPTTTRRSTPSPTSPAPPFPLPGPTATSTPGQPTVPGQTETVAYEVGGSGRAMSITYVDSGGVLQTEFNVPLPWSRQVELAKPAKSAASVTIINFGREITCSVSISSTVVEQRTGSGLTICGAMG